MRIPFGLTGSIICALLLGSARAADPPASNPSPATGSSPAEAEISDTTTRLELAKVLTYDKRYGEAMEVYRQVLAAEPSNLEAKIGLSEVLYWTGNSEAAAATLKGVPDPLHR